MKRIAGILTIAAGTTQAAGLADLAADAFAADPAYRSAEAAWRAGIEKMPQGRAGLLPQLGVQQSVYRNGVRIPGMSVPGYSTVGFTVTLNQPIFKLDAWEAYQQGRLYATDADFALAAARQELLLQVAQAYVDVLGADDDATLAAGHKDAVAAQLVLARRRFATGDATIVDVNEAQAAVDAAVADQVAADNQRHVKVAALEKKVGHPVARIDTFRDDARLPPVEPAQLAPWLEAARLSSHDVRRKEIAVQIARRERAKVRAGHFPTVSLVGNLNNGNAAFINGQANFYTGGNRGTAGAIGIQIALPLTDGLMTRSRTREALALEEKAGHDLADARDNAALVARDAFLGVTSGRTRVDALGTAVKSAAVALKSNQTGYRVGVRVNADVLEAGDKLYRAQRDLARARYETLMHGLRLKASVGALDTAELAAVDASLLQRAAVDQNGGR